MNHSLNMTRRHLLGGLGGAAMASLLGKGEVVDAKAHIAPRAKRVVYLFQAGGPSQHELFDPKPRLRELQGQELPSHIRSGQRLTGMSSRQASFPLVGSRWDFARHGQSGAWVSELLPHTAGIVDKLCIIRSMYTEVINHDPAVTFMQTGSQIPGRASFGSWVSYALGSENQNLPAFVVLVTPGHKGQPLYSRLWGSGFLDSRHQGVPFRSGRNPVLYLANPEGLSSRSRTALLSALSKLEKAQQERELDPAIGERMAQYELAGRMQSSVPEVVDLSEEPDSTYELYGEDARKPGTYAFNCLRARRLLENGVRFVQVYHQGWDQHLELPKHLPVQCKETDQASAALVLDLERRGLLDDTLVIWGGEFGRTAYCQGSMRNGSYGRDHHPRCFTMWMAGAGVAAGTTYGQTDEYGYNIVDKAGVPILPSKERFTPGAVHVHDLQATWLHLLGIDHRRLGVEVHGRRIRLTDVHGHVVPELFA